MKTEKLRSFLIFSLAAFLLLMALSPIVVRGEEDPFTEIEEKLAGISEEERNVIEDLFAIVQEVDEMERQEKGMEVEIADITGEIKNLEKQIEEEEIAYEKNRETLKQILQSYQRRGPGSYLEILLEAENLSTFLRRLNTLRDLTRNTGELLELLEESREKLAAENKKLSEKLELIEEKQKLLQEVLEKKLQIKEEMEAYLASLKEDRVYYEEHLEGIQKAWNELKLLFSEITRQFAIIIEKGNLPLTALKLTFTLEGVKGSIDEQIFNNIIAEHPYLSEMVVGFYPDVVEISVPKTNLILKGSFRIEDGNTLTFEAREGSFYGMPLATEAIEELFAEENFVLNLQPLVGSNRIHSIEIKEDSLELLIKPIFMEKENKND